MGLAEERMIERALTACFRKPRKNMPSGPRFCGLERRLAAPWRARSPEDEPMMLPIGLTELPSRSQMRRPRASRVVWLGGKRPYGNRHGRHLLPCRRALLRSPARRSGSTGSARTSAMTASKITGRSHRHDFGLLFAVMLTTAAGNTALQSVLP